MLSLRAVISVATTAIACAATSAQSPSVEPVSQAFFGLHVLNYPERASWPTIRFGAWRLWDNGVTWPDLEPRRGDWRFQRLDHFVDVADRNGVRVLLTLGFVPSWSTSVPIRSCPRGGNACTAPPRDFSDWADYVRAVASRYRGRINEYEIWNEPNTPLFYSGTTDQLVALTCAAYRELKSVDPRVVVLSPAASGGGDGVAWLDSFLAKGGGKCVDVVAFHFYVSPEPPEAIGPLVENVREVMGSRGVASLPLWNTETTWMDPKPFPSESLAAAYMARAYLIAGSHGIKRFYWYGWARPSLAPFFSVRLNQEDGATPTTVGAAYEELQRWIVGAQFARSCQVTIDAVWSCDLDRGTRRAHIIWRSTGQATLSLPPEWKATRMKDLWGNEAMLEPNSGLVVGVTPILVE